MTIPWLNNFQQPDVLELLLPFVGGLHFGMALTLDIPTNQMVIDSANGHMANKCPGTSIVLEPGNG